MTKILVTGAGGQVGSELQFLARFFNNYKITFVDRNELDITQKSRVVGCFRREAFDYCINAAAYTAVDKAESEPEIAQEINVLGTKNLAEACSLLDIPLIHLSTDYVYHNDYQTPIPEDASTLPQGVYASSKLEGEMIAKQVHNAVMIIRTSWVYSVFGNNFVKTMLKYGKERSELKVVYDQIGSPTNARDIAQALYTIIHLLESGKVGRENFSDTYHYSNEGVCSWYDFAKAIFDIKQIKCKVTPITTAEYPTPAVRPPFSLLDKTKIKKTFGISIPYWRDSLKNCLSEM